MDSEEACYKNKNVLILNLVCGFFAMQRHYYCLKANVAKRFKAFIKLQLIPDFIYIVTCESKSTKVLIIMLM
jgi:hypothetical protein